MSEVEFLTVEDVLAIHAHQVEQFGGAAGVRDSGLLASAVAQAEAAFDDAFLHHDVFEMAAAYLFHLCKNHPFLDGNKRTALAAALLFLGLNGFQLDADPDRLTELVLGVAEGRVGKAEAAVFFKAYCHPRDHWA